MSSELPSGRRRAASESRFDDSATASSAELAQMWSQISHVHTLRERDGIEEAFAELWAQLALLPILDDQGRLLRSEVAEVTYYLKVFAETADTGTMHEAASLSATFIDAMVHRRFNNRRPDDDPLEAAEAQHWSEPELVADARVVQDDDRRDGPQPLVPPEAFPRVPGKDEAQPGALGVPDPLAELRRSLDQPSAVPDDRAEEKFWDDHHNRPGFGVVLLAVFALAAIVAVSLYLSR